MICLHKTTKWKKCLPLCLSQMPIKCSVSFWLIGFMVLRFHKFLLIGIRMLIFFLLFSLNSGLPRMQVIRNYKGIPQPTPQDGPPLHIQIGDTIELITGDVHSLFWQVLYCLRNDRIPSVSDNRFVLRNFF